MRNFLAGALIAAGISVALYVGIYLMLYGGIVQVADAVEAEPVDGGSLAWGVIRIVFFESGTILAGAPLVILGYLLWKSR